MTYHISWLPINTGAAPSSLKGSSVNTVLVALPKQKLQLNFFIKQIIKIAEKIQVNLATEKYGQILTFTMGAL
jgi:hypothetical protein